MIYEEGSVRPDKPCRLQYIPKKFIVHYTLLIDVVELGKKGQTRGHKISTSHKSPYNSNRYPTGGFFKNF